MADSAPLKGTLMQGRRGLIMGVTNDRSLGWGIAAACAAQGAELAFTYQVEALGRRVRPLAASVGAAGRLRAGIGHFLLLVRCRGAARGTDDASGRQPADADLCRC